MKDIKIEYMRGTGPGGQHKNKTESACRVTHVPTGTTAYADTRSKHRSRKLALAELQQRLRQREADARAAKKKARRDHAIHNTVVIRTYDFSRGVVTDHRSKRTASLKNILDKGRIELLR